MSQRGPLGTLVLTIDLELSPEQHGAGLQRRLDEVRSILLNQTCEAGIPATWAVADPMLSAATESIAASNRGHEIAVLGHRAWLGPGCGRERLARELTRRFSAPRKAGIPVSTLALRNLEDLGHFGLLIEHGVTAVCGPAVDQPSSRIPQGPTRYRLWQPPDAWRLPLRSNWGLPPSWQVRRALNQTTRRQSFLHLRLEATQFVAAPDASFQTLSTILRHAADKRDAGKLQIKTVAELAQQSLGNRAAHPSRSILRPAA